MDIQEGLLAEALGEIARLQGIVEATKLINTSIEPFALYEAILTIARRQLNVERGTLFFVDESRHQIWARIDPEGGVDEIRLSIGKGIAGTVAQTGEPVILRDVRTDPRFDASVDRRSGFSTTSMLCVPIRNRKGRIVGVLQLLNRRTSTFSLDDVAFVESLSDHIAIAMENVVVQIQLLEKDRMQQELHLGREIQSRLLPRAPGNVEGVELAAASRPCYEVGGDYYDFIAMEGGDLVLAFGDVSGKGVAAAIIMSSVQAALRMAVPLGSDLEELARRLNGLLHETTRGKKYVTLFLGRYTPATGRLVYVNAGHNPPLVVESDGVRTLPTTGMPIGLMERARHQERELVIPVGASLVLYTDGLSEATNEEEEEFGLHRLSETAGSLASRRPEEILNGLLDAVTRHEGKADPIDDKTVVVLRRLS